MPRAKRAVIAAVNDDGIDGPGLRPLLRALARIGDVYAVVPERERSTASHSLSLHKPLRLRSPERGKLPASVHLRTLSGTPADCARFSVLEFSPRKPDLLVSGINDGYNLGQDVLYSGTVAAAAEGALNGVPSVAVSRGWGRYPGFGASASAAVRACKLVLGEGLPEGAFLNLNVPPVPLSEIKGMRAAPLGVRRYDKKITRRKDPRGGEYYWMVGRWLGKEEVPGSDIHAVDAGWVSLTPLSLDRTHTAALKTIRGWRLR